MITAQDIHTIVDAKISADGCFIVELTVDADNNIRLVVDKRESLPVSYCVELTELIGQHLDRDVEDYALEVSTAGIGCELKVVGQYEKNIGNEVEVTLPDGAWLRGVLTSCDAEGFEIERQVKEPVEGSKKKITVVKRHTYKYNEVKQVKDIISFK